MAYEMSLEGKVALITGTTSGFGNRFARVLADAGAKVAITGRRVERLEKLKAEIEAAGGTAFPVALDVMDIGSIEACVEQVTAELGPIDILVNNAGMNIEAMAVDMKPEDFDTMMSTNVRGAFFMAQAVGRQLIARKSGGRIINIASIGAHTVLPGLATYCMSKAAVAMMSRSLAREWARREINVNALCPGYIETELNSEWFHSEGGQKQIASFPRKRLGEIDDLDGILVYLASDASRFVTGSVITVDDGQSL